MIFAQKAGLTPIFCIGEQHDAFEAGQTYDVLVNQLHALSVQGVGFSNLIIAYEPIWSIGTGLILKLDVINKTINDIILWLVDAVGFQTANRVRLLYGGSMNARNAHQILGLESVDGVLVGGASLDVEAFTIIANAA